MKKFIDHTVSKIAIAVLIGGISLATPAHANDSMHHNGRERVETRIRTLHDKLHVTADQEPQWRDVAKVMRENEKTIHELVDARHENEPDNAVDDLKSYKEIADAHAEGLENLIPAFETFYDSLSDRQKARADALFGQFEGHAGRKTGKVSTGNNAE